MRGEHFEGVFNFRDLGGHRTTDGLVLRHGRLFRADDLTRLTDADQKAFADLGIRTVIDLRRPDELERRGRIAEFDSFAYHHVHIVHPRWPVQLHPDTADRLAFLRERYREMTTEGAPAIGEALRLIAEPERAPVVFHCIAGKDRTGLVAALTLSLLGVSDADIADDYHRSELAEAAAWHRYAREKGIDGPNPRAHIEVSPRQAIRDVLDDLRARYGSIEAYAAHAAVTPAHIATMRAHLLA